MRSFFFSSVLLACVTVFADEAAVSPKPQVDVTIAMGWKVTKHQSPTGKEDLDTFGIYSKNGRNAMCLVSILGFDKPEFTDATFLKKLLRSDSVPYEPSPHELIKVPVKELSIEGGRGLYSSFTDKSAIGKPATKGKFRTATLCMVSLGTNYLIKATVYCDDLKAAEFDEMLKMVGSLKAKKSEPENETARKDSVQKQAKAI